METTLTLADRFHVTPFVLFAQDVDEVIMVINHYLYKAENSTDSATVQQKSERDESAEFWAAL